MTTGTYASDKDFIKVTNGQAADTQPVVSISGGLYGVMAVAAAWGGGSLDVQMLAADGVTYVSVLPTVFVANGYIKVALPAGQAKFVITTTNGVYATFSRIVRGAGA